MEINKGDAKTVAKVLSAIGLYEVVTDLKTYGPKISDLAYKAGDIAVDLGLGAAKWGGNVWDAYSPELYKGAGDVAQAAVDKGGVIAAETGKYWNQIGGDVWQSIWNQLGASTNSLQDFGGKLSTGTLEIVSGASNLDATIGTLALLVAALYVVPRIAKNRLVNYANGVDDSQGKTTRRRRKTSRKPLDPSKAEPGWFNQKLSGIRDKIPRSLNDLRYHLKEL